MYEVQIMKDGKKTHGGLFETLNEANNWVHSQEIKNLPWGHSPGTYIKQFIDRTAEFAAKDAEEAANKASIAGLKANIADIDMLPVPPMVKEILKLVVKKL